MSRLLSLVTTFCVLALLFTAAGCVSKSSDESDKNKAKVEKYILDKAPDGIQPLGINFDDKITLLGYTISPSGPVKAGEQIAMTLYWRVDKEIGEKGWNLFTHLHDGAGKRIANVDNVGPLRSWQKNQQLMPPSSWKTGKVYADEQKFAAPAKNTTTTLEISTGIWKGNKRLAIKAGQTNNDDRGLIAKLNFIPNAKGSKKRSTKVPQLRADRLEKGVQLKIDGKLDEAAWKAAPVAGPFVSVRTGDNDPASPVQGSARLLWSEKDLFLGFEVQDSNVTGGFDKTSKDPHLWTKDTIEVMVDPEGDGDNKDYYEIQVNPQNLVFDSQFDEYNKPKKEPEGPFGHQEWSAKLESAVVIDGTLDKPDDKDKGYTVELRIPWASFSKSKITPPQVGNEWRMNFYVMQENSGVAWSPILGQGNFHKASRFGKLLWAERGWKQPETEKPADAVGAKNVANKATDLAAGGASSGAASSPLKRAMPAAPPSGTGKTTGKSSTP